MGHAISGGFLKAKDKDSALKEGLQCACDFAYYNGDRMEGSDEYHGNFRFYNERFEDEDEALEFFNGLGSYCDGVVQVKMPTASSKRRCEQKVKRYQDKIEELKRKHIEDFKQRKSKSVGCKKCGTRVDSETALENHLICPKCKTIYGSQGFKNRLQSYYDKIDEAYSDYKKDISQSGEYRFYAKYEVHC